jgi:hypothetical protein
MGKPLFASDRVFNREVCQEYANYFDPLSPSSAAHVIADYFSCSITDHKVSAARVHALTFSTAAERAKKYMQVLNSVLST